MKTEEPPLPWLVGGAGAVATVVFLLCLLFSDGAVRKVEGQAAPAQTRIFVSEQDGAPRGRVREFKFSNGSVTLNADGTASIASGGGETNAYTAGTGLSLSGANVFSFDAASSPTLTALTLSGLTASRALVSSAGSAVAASAVTATELGYLSGATSSIQTQLGTMMLRAGSTMTGQLILFGNPTNVLGAATKQYVDALEVSTASRTFTNITLLATSRDSVFFPAAVWTPTVGSAATAADQDYATTNLTTRATIVMPAAGLSRASFVWVPPPDYDGDPHLTIYHARGVSAGGAAVWSIAAQSFPVSAQVNAAMITTFGATNNTTGTPFGMIPHPSTGLGYGPLTVDGYAATQPHAPIVFRVSRDGDNASDNAGDTYVWGATVNYKKKATLANP